MMHSSFKKISSRLENCILTGNKEEWIALLMVEDDVAKQSMNKWFEDYFILHKVKHCQVMLLDSDMIENTYGCRCQIKAEYEEGKEYSADLVLYALRDSETGLPRITRIECFHQPVKSRNLNWIADFKQDKPWWKDILSIEKEREKEVLQPQQLARAVTRNIRFREAHIQLECASIMTSMMSSVIQNICRQLELPSENSEQKLKLLYDTLMDKFRLQIVRPDRDNTWASKYLAPWYGLEEILWGKEEDNRIAVSCNFFMSNLYALLRWSGFKVHQIVQFRIINQDYLIVKTDDRKLFLVSHDSLSQCKKSSIYPSGPVNRVFGAEWFIDFKRNEAEISSIIKEEYNVIAQNTFLPICRLPAQDDKIMEITLGQDAADFRDSLLRNGQRINGSIYPWIKYANQTLCVTKPETYVYWSIHSNWGNLELHSEKEIYQYVEKMGKESIFPEEDRLMTADQCIRHQTAGTKDRAVFLLAAFMKFMNAKGYVIFTRKYAYIVYLLDGNREWILYNASIQKRSKLLDGELILACNDRNSIFF